MPRSYTTSPRLPDRLRSLLLTALACAICLCAQAQPTRTQSPRTCQQNIDAWLATPRLKASPGLMEDLADCYATIEDQASAAHWYGQALAADPARVPCRRKYAHTLRALARYDEAISQMQAYAAADPDAQGVAEFVEGCRALMARRSETGRFEVTHIGPLCSPGTEVTACRHEDELYFYSRSPRRKLGRTRGRAAMRSYSLYAAPLGAWQDRRNIRLVARNTADSERHLGLVWDQTCSDYYVVRTERSPSGDMNPPAIYRSWIDLHGGVHEEKLELNGDVAISNFHPAISPDGTLLVFVSDREGGLGGTDLYFSYRAKNTWSPPQNLGPLVNSVRNESYPSFSAGGRLYFTSDGLVGFGKTDIFYADFEDGNWTAALNVGAAVNSSADDFGLVWNPQTAFSTGFFTSNRGDSVNCEVFAFSRQPELVGHITDAATGRPVEGAHVKLQAAGGTTVERTSGRRGEYASFLDDGRTYYLEVQADGYESRAWEFSTLSIPQGEDMVFDIALESHRAFTLRGRITDHASGAPLTNVTLRLLNGKTGEILRYDGSLGDNYMLPLERGVEYALLFQKAGYNSVGMPLFLPLDAGANEVQQDIRLQAGNQLLLLGIVTDASGERLRGKSRIELVNMKTKAVLQGVNTDADGNFGMWIQREWVGKYSLFASHAGVGTGHVHILADDDQFLPFKLEEMGLGVAFASRSLQHAYGQAQVDEASSGLLDDIYFFLLHNADVKMELRTYADARGTAQANARLSEERSQAIINDLLVRGGIAAARLKYAAYGESKPRNNCVDGVDCPEELHAQNRVTEVYFYR